MNFKNSGSRSNKMLPGSLYNIMTYSGTKFGVTMSKGLGGDTFTKKYII